MAHYIEDRDIQEGRKMGRHKLTQINDDLSLIPKWDQLKLFFKNNNNDEIDS